MIVKESGEKGVVVDVDKSYWVVSNRSLTYYQETELLTDLTAIEKPFGLLSPEIQKELIAVDNGENIQFYNQGTNDWKDTDSPFWETIHTYRLDPNYKQEEVKETKCESDGQIYTSYPPQYRCKHCLRWWFCSEPTPECGNKVKEMTVGEIEAKLGHRVKVVK